MTVEPNPGPYAGLIVDDLRVVILVLGANSSRYPCDVRRVLRVSLPEERLDPAVVGILPGACPLSAAIILVIEGYIDSPSQHTINFFAVVNRLASTRESCFECAPLSTTFANIPLPSATASGFSDEWFGTLLRRRGVGDISYLYSGSAPRYPWLQKAGAGEVSNAKDVQARKVCATSPFSKKIWNS